MLEWQKNSGIKFTYSHLNKSFWNQKDQYPEVDEIHLVNTKNAQAVEEIILKIISVESIACIISFLDSYVQMAANLSNQYLSANSFNRMEDKLLTRE